MDDVELLREENDTLRHLMDGYHLRVRVMEEENVIVHGRLDSFWDRLQELEYWVDKQESRALVERASSVINLTSFAHEDEDEEVVKIPGFPDVADIPQTLVPVDVDDENLPGEVRIL